MDKNVEEMIKKERLIGQKLLLVRIIHIENERGFSFIDIGHVAKWMNMSMDEVSQYVEACSTLDYDRICLIAAMDFCEGNYHLLSIFRFFYEVYGMTYLMLRLYREKSDLEAWIKKIKERYREKYQEKFGKEEMTNEELQEALDFFIKYYVNAIEKVRVCGFEWDVIVEMLKNDLNREEILALKLIMNKEN